MSINYATIAKEAKNAARAELRISDTLDIQAKIYQKKQELKSIEDMRADITKELATHEFNVTQAEQNSDPRIEDFQKSLENCQKLTKESLKHINRKEEDVHEIIEVNKQQLADIQAGKVKVSYKDVNKRAEELIAKVIEEKMLQGDFSAEEDTTVELN